MNSKPFPDGQLERRPEDVPRPLPDGEREREGERRGAARAQVHHGEGGQHVVAHPQHQGDQR